MSFFGTIAKYHLVVDFEYICACGILTPAMVLFESIGLVESVPSYISLFSTFLIFIKPTTSLLPCH